MFSRLKKGVLMRKLKKRLSLVVIVILCVSMLSNTVVYATDAEILFDVQEEESTISEMIPVEAELSAEGVTETSMEENGEADQISVLSTQEFEYENHVVDFSLVNQWNGGYQAEIKITNIGAEDIVNWSIEFDLAQEISNIWNAIVIEQSDSHYIIQNSGWNQDIPVGESISFGFVVNSDFTCAPDNYIVNYDFNEEKDLSNTFIGDGFEVDFLVTDEWSESYNAEVTIRNTGSESIENWSLEFKLDNDIKDIWNVQIVDESTVGVYTIKHNGWNQDIPSGGEISFGFTAEGKFADFPASYVLNTKKVDVPEEDYEVSYEIINAWDSGFTANIIVKNNTSETLEDWALEFDYNNQIDNIWNAIIVEQSNQHYVLNNVGYNQNILAGESLTIGMTVHQGDVEETINNILVTKYIMEEDTEMMKFLTNDTDGDGLPDYYEEYITYTDPSKVKTDDINHDGNRDEDGDGLSNLEEYKALTNAYLEDTEYDGLTDYDEIMVYGTNPSEYDTDFDGVGDWTEIQRGTDPLNPDTNGDGVVDGEETITFGLCENQYASLEPDKMGYSVNITITGKGDYNNKISLLDGTGDYQFPEIEYIVGAPLYIKHDEIDFEKATISFALTEKILSENDINNLQIASYNEETHEIEFMDTQIDTVANVLSCETTHFSYYFLIDVLELRTYYLLEGIDTRKVICDVVFVVDTTGSMSGMINNTMQGIIRAANLTKEFGLDIRYALVDYKDIYEDGIPSQNLGWCVTEDEFVEEIQKLNITGGGDIPESTVDALETARLSEFRSSAMKSIILVTDASYKEGTNYEGLSSMEEEIERLVEDEIKVSVLTTTYVSDYYNELVEHTGGQMFDMNSDFAEPLVEVYTSVKEDAENYTWVRLADGTVVKLLVDPETASKDDSTDTDGDDIADMKELAEKTVLIYDDIEYTVWKYDTNPAINNLLVAESEEVDAITMYDMYEGIKKITSKVTHSFFQKIAYGTLYKKCTPELARYMCNTIVLSYLQSRYELFVWNIITMMPDGDDYSSYIELEDAIVFEKICNVINEPITQRELLNIKSDIANDLQERTDLSKYIYAKMIDPISGDIIDFPHMSVSCNSHYNHETQFVTYPIELASWGGDLQTLAVDIADKILANDSISINKIENNINSKFLQESSFSTEDLLADIDAVNMSQLTRESYFVNAFEAYYLNLGVQKRFSMFLDYYNGEFEDKIDEVLPIECFPADKGVIVDIHDKMLTQIMFGRVPLVYAEMIRDKKFYLPTATEIGVLKRYFYYYILEESNKEWE